MKGGLVLMTLAFAACGGTEVAPPPPVDPAAQQKALEEENRRVLRIEDRDIAAYVQRKGWNVHTSGTGVRWMMVRDLPGDTARPGQLASVNHAMQLIDDSPVYASEAGRPESFRVEHDEVESGLHEGIQHMSPGDSAILIIPSHRAFGLIGDMEKVPPRSTVIYHIGLVDVRDP